MADRVTGEEARRIKRELLGVGDRTKHRTRTATPLKGLAREPGTQQRVYRFRFYPTPDQAAQLTQTFGACRWVYNEGLALRAKAWAEHRVSLGFAESCRALTGWKRVPETAWLREASSTVLQQSLRHLDAAFSRFFKGAAKYPQRKSKHRSQDSATYVRTGFRWIEDPERPGTASVMLAKQSTPLDVRWSRALPPGQLPVKLTVARDRSGRFFLSVLVEEVIAPLPEVFIPGGREPKAVGLDLGLATLVTLDDGEKLPHPRPVEPVQDRPGATPRAAPGRQQAQKQEPWSKERCSASQAKRLAVALPAAESEVTPVRVLTGVGSRGSVGRKSTLVDRTILPSTRIVRHVPAGRRDTSPWLPSPSTRRPGCTPAATSPPSTNSTCTSRTASSSSSSAPPAAASPPRCACSPAWRTSTGAPSASATATSRTCRPRTGTSRWCSRTTRSTRT